MTALINADTSSGVVITSDTSGSLAIQSAGATKATISSSGVAITNLTASGTSSVANLTATGTFGGGVITSGTAVATTSGTSVDFTSIPSWVKRITVMFNGISTNATSGLLVQLGTSGGITTSGYLSSAWQGGSSNLGIASTAGFSISGSTNAAYVYTGALILTLVSGNTWVGSGSVAIQPTSALAVAALGGNVTLSGAATTVRLTTINGTDTFDAGSVNILYEG